MFLERVFLNTESTESVEQRYGLAKKGAAVLRPYQGEEPT
jgi:hypothetical protein